MVCCMLALTHPPQLHMTTQHRNTLTRPQYIISLGRTRNRNQTLNEQDTRGLTALHHAAIWGHTEAVAVLLEYGAEANAANARGYTVSPSNNRATRCCTVAVYPMNFECCAASEGVDVMASCAARVRMSAVHRRRLSCRRIFHCVMHPITVPCTATPSSVVCVLVECWWGVAVK